ncbi:MAG: hypothetical protein DMG12_22565 [Acidobacteria bacterium]|nr:MAG: hypothetical protein DMG12_22565 [Acidobacteriota bacterium]
MNPGQDFTLKSTFITFLLRSVTDRELTQLTIASALSLLRRRELSPVELTQAVLERIHRLNERMRAFITVTADHALEGARAAEREIADGHGPPLLGIPISLKDLYDTKGILTTAGAKVFAERVPEEDATVVRKLREAGAVVIGKTNLHEFAFGVTTVNPHYGTARNPWDPERIAGGSSGGSAIAVALALGLGSMGSDTGGSIGSAGMVVGSFRTDGADDRRRCHLAWHCCRLRSPRSI